MIKVTFEEPQTTKWKRWLRDASKGMEGILAQAAGGLPYEIKDSMYKRRKEEIFAAFSQKCAYCETNFSGQSGDVEHFRPKGRVVDEKDSPVYLVDENGKRLMNPDNTPKLHPGYYWLAYNWENLLPSCSKCNSSNKGTRFPVNGFRAASPGTEKMEQPLFLHPLFDDPTEHFNLDVDLGILGGKTDRGEMCIKLLDLNRDGLLEDRRRTYTSLLAKMKTANYEAEDPNITKEELTKTVVEMLAEVIGCKRGRTPYSFAGRQALEGRPDLLERFKESIPGS